MIASHLSNQLLLLLGLIALTTGFTDLKSITLCLTSIVSLDLAVLVGSALTALPVLGQAISGIDFFLLWRTSRNTAESGPKRSIVVIQNVDDKQ